MDAGAGHTTRIEQLLARLDQGDETAQRQTRDELLAHAAGRLEKLARRMLRRNPRLRRWEETGDIVQNAALRLHRALATVRPMSARAFYGLAATQIRRELIDLARHHFGPQGNAAHHHTDAGTEGPGAAERHPDPEGEPSTLEEWSAFHEQVQELPEVEREVFDLLWYEGLTQQQAAEVLGVTERTIKNRWRSAKLLLAERLAGE